MTDQYTRKYKWIDYLGWNVWKWTELNHENKTWKIHFENLNIIINFFLYISNKELIQYSWYYEQAPKHFDVIVPLYLKYKKFCFRSNDLRVTYYVVIYLPHTKTKK